MGAFANNLPAQSTSFIGREAEQAKVGRLLEEAALLTLTGVGGVGKTRLAFRAAAEWSANHSGNTWIVELASVTSAPLVIQAAADALGVREEREGALLEILLSTLGESPALLVLDHCDHYLNTCASLAEEILGACPQVRVLATSRDPLRVVDEITWHVPCLGLPAPISDPNPGADAVTLAAESEAVQLFVARAKAVKPAFSLTPANIEAVVRTCRGLEGLPMALELVAGAQDDVLASELIAERISRRAQAQRRSSFAPEQTLTTVMQWSYAQLDEQQQRVLRRLSVYAGGCTLASAEAVWRSMDGTEAADIGALTARVGVAALFGGLVERSFVAAEQLHGSVRYLLPGTVRRFAHQMLDETDESEAMHQHHRDWFLDLAQRAASQLGGQEQSTWLERLEAEHDNLRAALDWSLSSGQMDEAVAMTQALSEFWVSRGHFTEGRRWLDEILNRLDEDRTDLRCIVLCRAGSLAWFQGDPAKADELSRQSLELARKSGDRQVYARSLQTLGTQAIQQGRYAEAEDLLTKSLALTREDPAMYGVSLDALANLALYQGYYGRAESLYAQLLTLARESGGQRAIGYALLDIGAVARLQGGLAQARSRFEESLSLGQEIGEQRLEGAALNALGDVALADNRFIEALALQVRSLELMSRVGDRYGTVVILEALASTLRASDRPGPATSLMGAAEGLRQELGTPVHSAEKKERDMTISGCRAALGTKDFVATWEAGRHLGLGGAMELARKQTLSPEA